MRMRKNYAAFAITAHDVGGTQITVITLGDVHIGAFWAATRHEDRALEAGHNVIATMFREAISFTEAVDREPHARIYDGPMVKDVPDPDAEERPDPSMYTMKKVSYGIV